MSGSHNHCEIRITDLRVPKQNMLGGTRPGSPARPGAPGPARLAHCMRWIGQAEIALDMTIDRSLKRFAHGSLLAEKQGIQWMIADSTMELYQSKLMVLHAAYKIDNGEDFKSEVSMAKHFVANALNRIVDRAIQVHGALGYSTDTPLWPRWRPTPAGRASPTAPTRSTSGALPCAPSRPTRRPGA